MIRRTAPALLSVLVLASGCTQDRNARHTIGLELDVVSARAAAQPEHHDPTLFDLARSDWAPVEFVVPTDGTVHGPTWTRTGSWMSDHPRQTGAFPTARSAVRASRSGIIEDVEIWVAPIGAASRTVQGASDLGDTPPWSTTASPSERYERSMLGADRAPDA